MPRAASRASRIPRPPTGSAHRSAGTAATTPPSPRRPASCCRPRRATSPARRSTSTAACTRCSERRQPTEGGTAMTQGTTQIQPEELEQTIYDWLEKLGAPRRGGNREARLEALDIDSLDLVEMADMAVAKWGAKLEVADVKDLTTVGEAIDLVAARVTAASSPAA